MDTLSIVAIGVIVIAAIVIIVMLSRDRGSRLAAGNIPTVHAGAPYNTLAIVAFIAAFIVSVAGIVFGHLALRDIDRRRERGRGRAIAALWIGYLSILATVATVVIVLSPPR